MTPTTALQAQLEEMERRKDGAYEERNRVVAALAKCFPSGVARTAIEGWSEDWHGCVYIDLPTGQVSWHFHDSQAHLFAGLPAYTKPWDGHDTPEKYRRVAALSAPAQDAQAGLPDLKDALVEHLCDNTLVSVYDCTRVWEAWQVGTMSEDDFVPASERADEIADDLIAFFAARTQPAPVPQDAQVGDVAASTQGHDGTSFLCRIWGEDIDHTLTAIVPDWDGVRRFCVENYTGSENHADYDGKLTLETLKENFDEHEAKGSAGAYVENWEIGGLSIERICDCTPARTQPATPAPVDAAATVPDLRERLAEAHDASLDTDHHACRAILMEIIRLLDTIPPAAPQAVPLTDHHKLDNDQQVFFYEQDFYVLSNFSSFALHWRGLDFPTSEHAYHWEKFNMRGEQQAECRNRIHGARSAHDAFKVAAELKPFRRAAWDELKVGIMRDILRAKAQQHEYVRRKLLATGDRELIEDSWRDDYWGWGPNRDGQNMLGKLWMEVRAELRAGIGTTATKEQSK